MIETLSLVSSLELPIRTVSEANTREHWTKSRKRRTAQRQAVLYALSSLQLELPLLVHLVRISPRKLDEHDNLKISFKYIVDAIADHLLPSRRRGIADSDPRLEWRYSQEPGGVKEYAIKILFFKRINKE